MYLSVYTRSLNELTPSGQTLLLLLFIIRDRDFGGLGHRFVLGDENCQNGKNAPDEVDDEDDMQCVSICRDGSCAILKCQVGDGRSRVSDRVYRLDRQLSSPTQMTSRTFSAAGPVISRLRSRCKMDWTIAEENATPST